MAFGFRDCRLFSAPVMECRRDLSDRALQDEIREKNAFRARNIPKSTCLTQGVESCDAVDHGRTPQPREEANVPEARPQVLELEVVIAQAIAIQAHLVTVRVDTH